MKAMRNTTQRLFATIALLAIMLLAAPASAVPTIDRPVNDYAHVLSDADVARITDRIVATRNATGVQVALLVVDTTDGEPIDDYALATAREWRGGSADRNDGVLITFAIRDRKSDIETGPGVQGRLTDVVCRRILDNARPAMRAARYGDAFTDVVTDVGETVGARFGGVASRHARRSGWTDGEIIEAIVLIVILIALLALIRSRRRGYGGDIWIFSSSSDSGGSSGGGWSGGGGGFDGGGGSSDW